MDTLGHTHTLLHLEPNGDLTYMYISLLYSILLTRKLRPKHLIMHFFCEP
jgi:hypothetical protein